MTTVAPVLDRDSRVPLVRQVHRHFERLIREGRLAAGVKLPATRELARTLRVNRATVAVAYEELVAGGWARAHVGQGTFVAERNGTAPEARPPAGAGTRPRAPVDWSGLYSRSARIIGRTARQPMPAAAASGTLVSFAGGMPDARLFPIEAFRRVLNRVVREEGAALLQYSPTGGYPPLLRYLASYLLRFGVEADPEEILIVNGSQQGFDLIARTLLDPGDVVAIEQPTYPRAMEVFRASGAQLLAVPWDPAGPRVELLERLLERHAVKFFYCQPSAHNPTGRRVDEKVARRLLEAASRFQVPVVEDGFDVSLDYGRRPPVPLRALDRDGLVLYIGTFSKILFPGLRLGWLVAPRPVVERLAAAKQLADLHTSPLIQAAVHRFCEGRLLDRHLARVSAEYARRRDALLAALRRRMPDGVTWSEPMGGFSLLVTLPAELDAGELLPRAVERGVAFTPGSAFFVDGGGQETLRLSFSAVPPGRIDEGVRRLAEVIRGEQKRAPRLRLPGPGVPVV
jgi:GntR family transcriptional regulator/MocR family aminotransferase